MFNPSHKNSIALIGASIRFPDANNIEQFWDNLIAGKISIRDISDHELRALGVPENLISHPNYVKKSSTISDIDLFDRNLFGYSLSEASLIDPQQRIFLEICNELLLKCDIDNRVRQKNKIGLFSGCALSTYLISNIMKSKDQSLLNDYMVLLSNDKDFLSTRVSYKLNLSGPSMALQTGCSTSLVAIHVAMQSLLNQECDYALAGGVSIRVPQNIGYLYKSEGILSKDGFCRPFDEKSSGTIIGNGAGVVLLKRYHEALIDGDNIICVVKGSAVNNDGNRKMGYTAPSYDGQREVLESALQKANIEPDTVEYIETHGTATALGDPIEFQAIKEIYFKNNSPREAHCLLGAVKANIGHLDVASGVAGFIKAALAIKHKIIPPNPLFNKLNSNIHFEDTPFSINSVPIAWNYQPHSPRRAGVSAFGIGGTNCHLILEEFIDNYPGENKRKIKDSLELKVNSIKERCWISGVRENEAAIGFVEEKLSAHTESIDFSHAQAIEEEPFQIVYERISYIIRKILNIENLNSTDSFFELGGNSLLAIDLISQIEGEYNISISLQDIYLEHTPEKLSNLVLMKVLNEIEEK